MAIHTLSCSHEITTEQLLDHVERWFSNQSWAMGACPSCHQPSYAELENELVVIGVLDGFPGPCFIANERKGVPGLSVQGNAVTLGKRRWLLRTKRS